MKNIKRNAALRGGEAWKIENRDFIKVLERKKPPILSWYVEARRKLRRVGKNLYLMGLWMA